MCGNVACLCNCLLTQNLPLELCPEETCWRVTNLTSPLQWHVAGKPGTQSRPKQKGNRRKHSSILKHVDISYSSTHLANKPWKRQEPWDIWYKGCKRRLRWEDRRKREKEGPVWLMVFNLPVNKIPFRHRHATSKLLRLSPTTSNWKSLSPWPTE